MDSGINGCTSVNFFFWWGLGGMEVSGVLLIVHGSHDRPAYGASHGRLMCDGRH